MPLLNQIRPEISFQTSSLYHCFPNIIFVLEFQPLAQLLLCESKKDLNFDHSCLFWNWKFLTAVSTLEIRPFWTAFFQIIFKFNQQKLVVKFWNRKKHRHRRQSVIFCNITSKDCVLVFWGYISTRYKTSKLEYNCEKYSNFTFYPNATSYLGLHCIYFMLVRLKCSTINYRLCQIRDKF